MYAYTSEYGEARTSCRRVKSSTTAAVVAAQYARAMPSAREKEALVGVGKKFPLLMNFGVRVLMNANQLSASQLRVKKILVFDPAVEELQTSEWISTLGAFATMINRRPDDDFYLCPVDYFESYVASLAMDEYVKPVGSRAFILEHYQKKYWLLYPSDRQNRAPSSSQNDRGKKGERKYPDDLSQIHQTVESDRRAEIATSYQIEQKTVESSEYNNKIPRNGINSIGQIDEPINILLLGETGVGKSTFINAYYNYLTFGSLEKAMAEPKLHGLVCSTFSFTDSKYNIKTFTVPQNVAQRNGASSVSLMQDGVDCRTNEVYKPGQSSTQHAKAYEFRHQGRLIRLIDTPGIGDSRGVRVDQTNFKQTIEYLAQMDHLNAVCILLKPNVKRMELQTRYCIKELFSHLNKVSIQNIVFCFTNTRGTSFRPGDTLPSLQQFVAEEIEAVSNVKVPLGHDNIVCMDNEAFRYLVLAKNVKSAQERASFNELGEQGTFAESWRISKEASEKLVKYAETLPVLKMSEMVAYNQSRSMSLELVQKIIDVLVQLAMKRTEMQSDEVDDANLDYFFYVLIASVAAVTAHLGSKAVTVFNDQFDAHLEEKINALKQSTIQREFRILRFMQSVRDEYKRMLKELRSFRNTGYYVKKAICELSGLLDIVLAKLNEFFEQKAFTKTQPESFKTTHVDPRFAPARFGLAGNKTGACMSGWSLKNVFYDIRRALASISSKILPSSFLKSMSTLDRENQFENQTHFYDDHVHQSPKNVNATSTPKIRQAKAYPLDYQYNQYSNVSAKPSVLTSLPTRQHHLRSTTQPAKNVSQKMMNTSTNSRPSSSSSSNRGRAGPRPQGKSYY